MNEPTAQELLDELRGHLMLEIEPGNETRGTEGRPCVTLWYLPFGRGTDNQFGKIIKYGLGVFVNSYDDPAKALFARVLNQPEILTGDEAFTVKSAPP